MAYTPPVGDVVFDFLDGYTPPVGEVDLSFNGSQSIFITGGALLAQAALAGSFVPPQVAVNGSFSITARLRGSVSYLHIDSSLATAAVLGGAGRVWYNAIVTDGSLQALAHLNGEAHPQYQFRVNPVEVRRLLRVERRQLSEVTEVLRMIPEGD